MRGTVSFATALVWLASSSPAWATNVVVIVADDLGADKVSATLTPAEVASAYFLPATPTLDELAYAGLTFTHAWAEPICSPSRAAFLTGDFPHTSGVARNIDPGRTAFDLTIAETTVAEEFAAAGWDTAAFGKWHLGNGGPGGTFTWTPSTDCPTTTTVLDAQNPLLHGFNVYEGEVLTNGESYVDWSDAVSPGDGTTQLCYSHDHIDDEMIADAVEWIAPHYDVGTWQPYFVYIALKAPHFDGEGGASGYEENDLPTSCAVEDPCLTDGVVADCGDADGDGRDDEQIMLLQAMVGCVDGQVARLLAGIDALGPGALDDTLLVFWGDNGTEDYSMEFPFNQTATYGKGTMYESGLRVPLLIAEASAWEDVHAGRRPVTTLVARPGRVVTRDVHVMDLYDTLTDVLGVTASGATDGDSVAACFTNVGADCGLRAARPQYAELYRFAADGVTLETGSAAYKRGDLKLQIAYSPAGNCLASSLFQLGTDPYERTDVQPTSFAATMSMRATLEGMGIPWYPRSPRGRVKWCP